MTSGGQCSRQSQLRGNVAPDAPLRLSVAAALAFPNGSMTTSGLRREAERGRLVIERIAGKDYTTLTDIARMRALCRKPPKDHASGSAESGVTDQVELPNYPSGGLVHPR
jgi:hypothetical protein